jgi:hypothetical protein
LVDPPEDGMTWTDALILAGSIAMIAFAFLWHAAGLA